jgi:hypothetical protein
MIVCEEPRCIDRLVTLSAIVKYGCTMAWMVWLSVQDREPDVPVMMIV